MIIVAIETSSSQATIALDCSGQVEQVVVASNNRSHSHALLPAIAALLAKNNLALSDVTAFAVGVGPGSFTGLRLACATVQGLAVGVERPIIAVSSLKALAQQSRHEKVLAVVDARQEEFYVASYHQTETSYALRGEEQALSLNEMEELSDMDVIIGDLTEDQQKQLPACLQDIPYVNAYPEASAIAALATEAYKNGEAIDAADLHPNYIRHKVTRN